MPRQLNLGDNSDTQLRGMANDSADLILGIIATIGTRGLLVDELAVFLPEGIPVLLHTIGSLLRQ